MSSPFVPIADVAEHFKVNQATVRGWLKAWDHSLKTLTYISVRPTGST